MSETEQTDQSPPNRLKVYYLGQRELLCVLRRGDQLPREVAIPEMVGPPAGAKVHHVYHSPNSMSFGVVVEHESFPEVSEGQLLPEAVNPLQLRVRAFAVIGNDLIADWSTFTTDQLKALREAVNEQLYDRERK